MKILKILSSATFILLALGVDHSAQATAITVMEFADFQCPYSRQATETVAQLQKAYGARIKFEYRNEPLDKHPNAHSAAIAGICAKEQNQFEGMYELLFANQDHLGTDAYDSFAQKLNLNLSQFKTCLTSDEALQALDRDLAAAAALHVKVVPTFFLIGDHKTVSIEGAQDYSVFKTQIDSLLREQSI